MVLEQIGADVRVRELFRPYAVAGSELGRISFSSHEQYRVILESAECEAAPAGRLRWCEALPAVGDWVAVRAVDPAFAWIEAVLPRRTWFSRRAPGKAEAEQAIAANVDVALIVCGLDGDFNLARIERYLVLVRESGAEPVVVLNKADLSSGLAVAVEATQRIAGNARVVAVTARESVGLLAEVVRGRTAALVGSSGVGKSTIANRLLGEDRLAMSAVRVADSRGRHTTTTRMLLPLPGGGALIDNPGMRELQLWANEQSLDDTFEDIAAMAEQCRFADCTHTGEPGCAVRAALESGAVEDVRWQSYRKLRKEMRHQALQLDVHARNEEKRRWKVIAKDIRNHPKYRR
jgi:ribosome biogenesis GTPase